MSLGLKACEPGYLLLRMAVKRQAELLSRLLDVEVGISVYISTHTLHLSYREKLGDHLYAPNAQNTTRVSFTDTASQRPSRGCFSAPVLDPQNSLNFLLLENISVPQTFFIRHSCSKTRWYVMENKKQQAVRFKCKISGCPS